MDETKPKIDASRYTRRYLLKHDGREVVFVGKYVAICWNVSPVIERTERNGVETQTKRWPRNGKPYIDALDVIDEPGVDPVKYKHSPVVGGMLAPFARQLGEGLIEAATVLDALNDGSLVL